MTEADVVNIMRAHLEGHFPKGCASCGHPFASLRDYLLAHTRMGPAAPSEAQPGYWPPVRPLGTLTFARCRCGTALALSSDALPLATLWSFLRWVKTEKQVRGVTTEALVSHLTDEIRKQVLATP